MPRTREDFDETIWGHVPPAEARAARRKAAAKKKKTARKKRGFKFFLLLFFVAIFLAFSFVGYQLCSSWLGDNLSEDEGKDDSSLKGGGTPVKAEETVDEVPVLLMGVDRRGEEIPRADTIMLALINRDDSSVRLLSIPRDTYTKVPGHGRTKINHAFAYGGPELMLRSVNELLDLGVEKYVVVDFEGFINLIDILGGVEMEVEKRMYYPAEGIDLQPGLQELNGEEALQYVRFRSDGRGDIGRVERQQKFLKKLSDSALRISTIWKLPDLLKEIKNSVDTNLTPAEMLKLAAEVKGINKEQIRTKTLPGWPDYIKGISYWIPDTTDLEKVFSQ